MVYFGSSSNVVDDLTSPLGEDSELERLIRGSIANADPLVGAAVVAVRRQGAVATFNQINQFFLINKMIVPGAMYWNMGFGLEPGEVLKDEEGMNTMADLGKNMAWLLKKIKQ